MTENLKLWNRKLVQIGNSYGFIIPKTFIEDSKHVEKGKKYVIEIKPLIDETVAKVAKSLLRESNPRPAESSNAFSTFIHGTPPFRSEVYE